MDLSLTEDQRMVRSIAREFLEKECPTTLVRQMETDETGFPPALWSQMAELGWMGLAIAEDHGGAGMTLQELAILIEEFGRHMVPGPFLPSVVLCGTAISEFGSDEQKAKWLPGIADGSVIFSYAQCEPNNRWDVAGVEASARLHGDSYVLNGSKVQVPFAEAADFLLVAARTEEAVAAFIVDAASRGVRMEQVRTIGADHAATVTFEAVAIPEGNLLGMGPGDGRIVERVSRIGAAAKCAEMVGGARRALEMSLQFANERKAFGKPIGAFQAIQHRFADMVTDVDSAQLITYEALWRLAQGADAGLDASVAKAWASDACRRVLLSAHQVHGAIGFTEEHDLQLFTRRAKSAEIAFGDASFHREQIAGALCI
jgi:3-oxocholest-4-en-26-oyl-CoA dehydrogenase beta subunit